MLLHAGVPFALHRPQYRVDDAVAVPVSVKAYVFHDDTWDYLTLLVVASSHQSPVIKYHDCSMVSGSVNSSNFISKGQSVGDNEAEKRTEDGLFC
jgi:hypothetical protein